MHVPSICVCIVSAVVVTCMHLVVEQYESFSTGGYLNCSS